MWSVSLSVLVDMSCLVLHVSHQARIGSPIFTGILFSKDTVGEGYCCRIARHIEDLRKGIDVVITV